MNNISLILVTYNRADKLEQILQSISNYNWEYDYLVIVDNNSIDSTKNVLNHFSKKLSNLKTLYFDQNIGHGAALAEAFCYLKHMSSSKYYILLEDDSIPERNLLSKLYNVIFNSSYDIISSYGMKVSLGSRKSINPLADQIVDADFCLLDGAIIKANIIPKVGLPEKDWFMMFDDFEYCYRIKKSGCKIGVIKNDFHQILHLGGGEMFSRSNLWRGYYQSRNHIFFLKKHFNLYNLLDFIIIQFKRLYGSMLAPDRFIRTKFRLIGILHGIRNLKGRTLDPSTLKFNKTSF